jgi:hypothetical protein
VENFDAVPLGERLLRLAEGVFWIALVGAEPDQESAHWMQRINEFLEMAKGLIISAVFE